MKLEIGYNHPFEIRRESYFSEDPLLPEFSVLYLSDLHLNRFSEFTISKVESTITELNPAVILLGGDYVDSNKGLKYFTRLLSGISDRKNVFAIAGNHDYYFGIEKIKELVELYNITWLEDACIETRINDFKVSFTGSDPAKTITGSGLNILCLHKPIDIERISTNYNLVFAGHLHGSQFVFWETPKGLYPGRLFYKWNTLKVKIANCLYLISKGLGDTLPVRYNCRKDIIFIEIKNKFLN